MKTLPIAATEKNCQVAQWIDKLSFINLVDPTETHNDISNRVNLVLDRTQIYKNISNRESIYIQKFKVFDRAKEVLCQSICKR